KKLSLKNKILSSFRNKMMAYDFKNKNNSLWCENEYISQLLRKKFPGKKIHTVSNNCNQVYFDKYSWDNSITLPKFDGFTFLTITANYPHKNLRISVDALEVLKEMYPDLNIRFVFTIKESDFGPIPEDLKDSFVFLGPISINQCPHLYEQADIIFQPSLLECFSATYPEAMLMKKPILTTDLGFAYSLCGEAACYYSADDPVVLTNTINKIVSNKNYREELVKKGLEQIKKFDSFEIRAKKLINIITKA
ncbi:MAG: glycosyltransferase, partial [Muribaculaceae bacterium]|nr:glycosyltransferase [Muribaculaceae bacterium]